MKRDPILEVSIATTPEAEDAVAEIIGSLFNQPAAIYTNEETKTTRASVYCSSLDEWNDEKQQELESSIARLRGSGLNAGTCAITVQEVKREDWAESWKRHFRPLKIGTRLLILPSWIKRRHRKGQAIVVLDPGLSFGTGHHPTTSFCLHLLTASRKPGRPQSFLDAGTGSGILAIAAAKLGYANIEAFDFDPEAIRVARENAAINKVSHALRLSRRDVTLLPVASRKRFDVICANLISNLLINERQRLINRLAEHGTLILAGILKIEFHEVQNAFEAAGLKLIRSKEKGEWKSGAFAFKVKRA